ncbi:hypothetical protein L0F63_002964, partial [Massospora cicadina]
MRFDNNDEVKDEVERYLNDMAISFYGTGILKLPQQLNKCFERNGDYIENSGFLCFTTI